ncbi:enoyl-CoA hydratase-related protein [Sphingomonas sp. KRR8]|uniref:enoyl-CoA hydratase/isomerase family protein n=1 Tax=Sphingomonas sp. KRR8 TaxID=2942996 RepID=UPI002021994A|nr:enoyl-CoA hydratase-related protein [Sphingomonas sp. KRR8]URD59915.1 enoyl-CoA hydratase-related protein [Sphingomonas sp. KRR8]
MSGLDLQRDGAVAVLTLDRPASGNAIDRELAAALLDTVLALDSDTSVRAVVLTGRGRFFCTGGDLRSFAAAGDAGQAIESITAPLHMAIARLMRLAKPLVVAVNGPAAGAGLGLALLGDAVLAGPSARFTVAYGAIGLSPDAGTSWLLPRLVGLRQAQRLALLGEAIDAEEAFSLGMVTRVVADDDLAYETMALAGKLAAGSMSALQRTRRLLLDSFDRGLEAQLEREAESIAAASRDADGREGISAFLSKRSPVFDQA